MTATSPLPQFFASSKSQKMGLETKGVRVKDSVITENGVRNKDSVITENGVRNEQTHTKREYA